MSPSSNKLYIGLMSGTSMDGIDAALVDFSYQQPKLLAFHYQPFSAKVKERINELSKPNKPIFLKQFGELDNQLGHLFANSVLALIKKSGAQQPLIKAIGSHGQTVHHAPDIHYPFSLQIGDPNIIAETTGITTIADFRRRDMAAGGQGAPLAPAFHQMFFAHAEEKRAVINIGGIANITVLPGNKKNGVLGFDIGPGNTLMDYWTAKIRGVPFDKNGAWAKTGSVIPGLLNHFKRDPYFAAPPPKSTGKEYFSSSWLENNLRDYHSTHRAEDIQSTLCQLTADTINDAVEENLQNPDLVLICGGGAHNTCLVDLIRKTGSYPVTSTEQQGINPDHVEAIAFAWLAKQALEKRPGNLCPVTGAAKEVILGGIYPAP